MRFKIAAALVVTIGAGAAFAQFFNNDLAARVNGEAISQTELKAVLDQRPAPVSLTKEQEREMRKAALNLLIDDVLMRQYLRRSVPQPSPGEVEKIVGELKEALKKQNKTLDQFLREEKQTERNLRDDIGTDLQWKAFLSARFSENETKAYFEANRPFFEKVQVKASHILIKVAKNASPAERENLRARLDNLRNVIKAGQQTFDDAARKYSDCPSKERGGDLGYFTYKFMVVPPFARAAFETAKGEISPVVSTDFGMHLILVTDRTEPDPVSFDALSDIVRKTMAQETDLFRGILAEQRRSAKVEILIQ